METKYTDSGHAGRIREHIAGLKEAIKAARRAGLWVAVYINDDGQHSNKPEDGLDLSASVRREL